MRNAGGLLLVSAVIGIGLLPQLTSPTTGAAGDATTGLRRPVALVLADEGKTLFVANRDSGTVAIVDTQSMQKIGESQVGRRLSDLVATADGRSLLVGDEEAGEIACLERRGNELRRAWSRAVGLSPVSVRISADGKRATVACLWPRRLAVVDLPAASGEVKPTSGTRPDARPVSFVDLPFAPRRQLPLPGGRKLIVADAFGGQLAVVDVQTNRIDSIRDLGVHNIRGLALTRDGKKLLVTHQTLFALGRTTRGDIVTGNLLTNNLQVLSLADVLDSRADIFRSRALYQLGDVERGAGDPAEVVEADDGQILVTVSGVDELASGRPESGLWQRLPVGRRPTALALDARRGHAYVANTFADSISVVDVRASKVVGEVRLGPDLKLRPEQRGELLFHDARLSHDAWFSCQSCHADGHTNGLLNDNFSDGSFGTPKRVLSLLGGKDTGPWAWNGKMPSLEEQVRTSVTSTMQGPRPTAERVSDLAAYVRTLTPPPGLAKARGTWSAEASKRGQRVFTEQKCGACHGPPTYTSPKTYDVGLRDEAGLTHFNPPSLRGVSQGGPFFHDNRARTLREVFTRHRHQVPADLSARDLEDLLHFLSGL